MKDKRFAELATLFFVTRQIIKQWLPPKGKSDPYMWLRLETLRYIAASNEPTMYDVARHLRIKAPSATSLIAHLAKLGFISRKGEKEDKRVVRIALTAAGKKEVDAYAARSAAMMHKVFSKLDDRELDELLKILGRVRDIHD